MQAVRHLAICLVELVERHKHGLPHYLPYVASGLRHTRSGCRTPFDSFFCEDIGERSSCAARQVWR